MADNTASSTSSDVEKVGVKEAHHEHHEVQPKEPNALRIDGDDEDHMHEPPVRHTQALPMTILTMPDDIQEIHEFGSHGFPLDWITDPGISLR
jgi:hypothetical protein